MEKPTAKDIAYLQSNPETAAQFDEVFGDGMAAKIMPRGSESAAFGYYPQMGAKRSGRSSDSSAIKYAGAATRGLAAPLVGAVAGTPFGPAGQLVGSMAVPVGDALNALINMIMIGGEKLTGKDLPRLQMLSKTIQEGMTKAGVAQPETTGQRMVEAGFGALGGTGAALSALPQIARQASTPVARELAARMSVNPVAQLSTSIPAGATSQLVAEKAQPIVGDIPASLLGMAAGLPIGSIGMQTKARTPEPLTLADQRNAAMAGKAKVLGFTDELGLTPAQAGAGKTAQLFEAVASTLPFSSTQFTKKFNLQSDYAEKVLNQIANMYGGMPSAPDVAFAGGAKAVRQAAESNVSKIGESIKNVSSQSDIVLSEVPNFRSGIMKARELLNSLPPSMRKEPLFKSFEEFYFGAKNEALDRKVQAALDEAGIKPTNANYKQVENKIRQQLIDSGTPEYSYQGYEQKGYISGSDYQDQRKLFSDLAYEKRGSKIGDAFRQLRDTLDDARDITFKNQGLDEEVTKLKNLRGSYGDAVNLNQRFSTAKDSTIVKTIASNESGAAEKIIPLLDEEGKLMLARGVLADIKLGSLNPEGDLDITKFGKNIIKTNEKSPSTLPSIFGQEPASVMTDLADVAQSALKPKIGSSQTSERSTMANMLTSGPAKIAGILGGSTAMGVPLAAGAASLGIPPMLTKAYLSPAMQNFYQRLNIKDPLLDYMASPAEASQLFAASPQGLLGLAPDLSYRIDLTGMANPD
jgi:hypothetical protein